MFENYQIIPAIKFSIFTVPNLPLGHKSTALTLKNAILFYNSRHQTMQCTSFPLPLDSGEFQEHLSILGILLIKYRTQYFKHY